MKKIIQIVSFLALIFVLAGVDVQAQNSTRIEAEVPFDFVIGDKSFSAGKYVMRIRRVPSGADLFEVRDAKNRIVYEAFALSNGETGDGKAHFIFNREDGVARLSTVATGWKGFTIPTESSDALTLASKKKKDGDTKN